MTRVRCNDHFYEICGWAYAFDQSSCILVMSCLRSRLLVLGDRSSPKVMFNSFVGLLSMVEMILGFLNP